jgi:HEAT repeats
MEINRALPSFSTEWNGGADHGCLSEVYMEGPRPYDPGSQVGLPQGEESFELDVVVGLFTRLAIACKSRSLYPADHPASQESAHVLFTIIQDALADIPLIEVQVASDTLIYKDWQIGKSRESLRQLASRIRALNIQAISLMAGITKHEVEAFVELLVRDPVDLEVEGGAEAFATLKGLSSVSIIESSAQLAGYEGPRAEDLLRGPAQSLSAEEDLPEDEALSDDLENLLNILFNPQELAALLMRLTTGEGVTLNNQDLADVIFIFLKDRSRIVIDAYPDLADKCMRSMAEALLFLRTNLRNQLLLRKLIREIAEEAFCREILRQFNPQEISDILCHFFPLAPELVPATRDILSKAGFAGEDLDNAIEHLRYRLIDLGEISPALIATLKAGEPRDSEVHLPSLEEISATCSQYGVEEMKAIKNISQMDLARDSLLGTTPMLLDLLSRGLKVDNLGRVVELLEEHFWDFMAEGDLRYVNTILERMLPLLNHPDPAMDQYRAELKRMIDRAGSEEAIRDTVRMVCNRRAEEPQLSEDLKSYIGLLEERGIAGLIEALGSEEDMQTRKFIVDILTGFSRKYLHVIGHYMDDPRWYLVRNMVTIMASIHSPEAIPYLRVTFNYDNFKVRAETVRALGLTGGYEASLLLIRGLEDPDENIRLLCARWLGRLGEEKAVGRLIRMLEDREPGAESLTMKKEIISSLGRIKAPESYQTLRKFANRQKLTKRSQWREVNQTAGEALNHLLEKYPHLKELQ